jgi:hypothetical protein
MRLVVVNESRPMVLHAPSTPGRTRGACCSRSGRAVRATEWDDECTALYADVGDGDVVYEAAAYFQPRRALLEFMFGECTCPVATNCAHVVASVLTAVRLLRRRCRHGGAPALGTHAPHAVRPGPTVARRPARAWCRSPSSSPCPPVARGPASLSARIVAARAHRLGRRRPDLAQRELALLTGQLRAGTRAGPGRAVCAPQRRRQARRLPLRRVRPGRSTSLRSDVVSGPSWTRRARSGCSSSTRASGSAPSTAMTTWSCASTSPPVRARRRWRSRRRCVSTGRRSRPRCPADRLPRRGGAMAW